MKKIEKLQTGLNACIDGEKIIDKINEIIDRLNEK